jgi:hypothetical protein
MDEKSFLKEWNERAGFVAAIAVINPIILTLYILFWHRGSNGLEFWLVGMGLTFIVCFGAGAFMLLVILADRRKRAKKRRHAEMWADVLPRNSRNRPATTADAG